MRDRARSRLGRAVGYALTGVSDDRTSSFGRALSVVEAHCAVAAARAGDGRAITGALTRGAVVAACADVRAIGIAQALSSCQHRTRSRVRRTIRVHGAQRVADAALSSARTIRVALALSTAYAAHAGPAYGSKMAIAALVRAEVASRRDPVNRAGSGVRQIADFTDSIAGLGLNVVTRLRHNVLAARIDDTVAGLWRNTVARLRPDAVASLRLLSLATLPLGAAAGLRAKIIALLALFSVARLRRHAGAALWRAATAGLWDNALTGLGRVGWWRIRAGLRLDWPVLRPQRTPRVAPQNVVVLIEIFRILRRRPRRQQRVGGGVDLRIGDGKRRRAAGARIDVRRSPRVVVVAVRRRCGGRACRRASAVGAAMRGIVGETDAPVGIAPHPDRHPLGEVDILDRARPRVSRHTRPVHGIGRVHLRIGRAVVVSRRIVGQPRVVIAVVEFGVVNGRRPQGPVFVHFARQRRVARGIALEPRQRSRIDAARARRSETAGSLGRTACDDRRRRAADFLADAALLSGEASRSRATHVEGAVIRRERQTELLVDISGGLIFAMATEGQIRVAVESAACSIHVARDVAAILADGGVGQEVVEHRRRIVDGQHDVRLGLVLHAQGLIAQSGQRGVAGRRQRSQADERRQDARKPASPGREMD